MRVFRDASVARRAGRAAPAAVSPPSWSQPASRMRTSRSAASSSSTPQAFASQTEPSGIGRSLTSAPVGADDAVEAVAAAQQAGDHLPVEAEADGLELGADRTAVVRHDLRGPGGEGRLERAAGDPRSGRRGRPDPCRTGSAGSSPSACGPPPGKCLVMQATLCRAELVALEAADVGRGQAPDQLEVLAERAADPRPARLGGDIRHRVKRDVDADGAILLARDLAEAAHELLVARRGEPDRLRPLREAATRPAHNRVLVERVARIGRDRDRDAEPGRLGEPLQAVVPFARPRAPGRRVDVEVVEVAIEDETRRAVAAERRRALEQLAFGADRRSAAGTSGPPSPRASSAPGGRRPAPRAGAGDPRRDRAGRCR